MKRRLIRKVSDKNLQQHLYKAIAALRSSEDVKQFFQDLCTPAELQAMADRWYVVPFLNDGQSYRQIYEKTGVSVTTIGRVARCLMADGGGYQLILKRGKINAGRKNDVAKNKPTKK